MVLRAFLGAVMVCVSVAGAAADTNLRAALDAVRAQDWDAARAAQARIGDPAGRDVVSWSLLRARQGSFEQAQDFLARNGDWPGLPLLRARVEAAIAPDANPDQVLRYFAPRPPSTAQGALRFSEALTRLGERDAARAVLIRHWRNEPMDAEDHALFIMEHGATLAGHHQVRLDNMVWAGAQEAGALMLPLVPEPQAALARARLALRADRNGVDGLINAVPTSLRDDPGLVYERFRWRLRKGRLDAAMDLLFEASRSADTLGRPEVWAQHRERLARRLMQDGRDRDAYRVASEHRMTDVSEVAMAEWLAGYIALRKLNDAPRAVQHFERFTAAVGTPISFGRGGYWLGRAQEAAVNLEAAAQAYAFGARFQTSFYGQLAAERAGLAPDPLLTGQEAFADYRSAPFVDSSVLRAALVLRDAGQDVLAERFFTHLTESLPRREVGQLIELVLELEEPHIAIMIGKRAAQAGVELHRGYYAVLPKLVAMDGLVAPELSLSIARRESEFDPVVVSPAGARGLMQLMPGTAKEMAQDLGETHSLDRLLTDPVYNARLGTAYLAELQREFGANVVLVSAAYNAGPTRARRWVEELGHPGDPSVDVVDWIEHVPFTETRNYIMRVSESLAIYRARLSGQTAPLGLGAALTAR